MGIPVVPTLSALVTEGLRQGRIFTPTQAQISLYSGDPIEQLKNTLWTNLKQAKPLMTFSYLVLVPGQSRYSCPTDFASDMSMVILTGLYTGTTISASGNTLTVSTTPNGIYDINQVLGEDLCITGGTASASVSQVIGLVNNNNGTQTFTVYPNFQGTPDATSTWMLVDNQYPVEADHIANYDRFRSSELNRPRKFYSMGDEDYDEFIFNCAPDNVYTYVVRMRYTVNIMTLDTSSQLMSTLYQKFRDYWIQGIRARVLADNMDDEAPAAEQVRDKKLQELIMSQVYGTDIRTLRQHVEDYQ
jgi:hypothetical protein